ncbi:GGDEF domain-containing protein [Devosia epidermidihirudinis]|uniref:GGDEF domain-containing protein n=1 Tax=Devosia epidermidihirudinis TaxID=1293439 RepID=UPI000A610471|nr:GGDEF domain-containing protein [Devosia epidermidihirudinis]
MQTTKFSENYARYYAWMLKLGVARALALTTAIATTTSVLVTIAVMLVLPAPEGFFWYGILVAILSPVLSAPGLGLLAWRMVYHLDAAQTALTRAADTDALTGVANRRSFMVEAELAFSNARATGAPMAIVMLDIDHFKAINDTYGHSIGDDVLRAVARACNEGLRGSDCFARFGGEEFVALLRMTDGRNALTVAEMLRKTVANLAFPHKTPPSVTVSLGVAGYTASCNSLHDILNEADRQLYAAKAAGRNRVASETNAARIAS